MSNSNKGPKKFGSRKQLGKGIGALLANIESEVNSNTEKAAEVVKELSNTVAMVPLNTIKTNPYQPRTEFDEQAIQELSDSIRVHGLIQPITVRRLPEINNEGKEFELISGERRFRASKLAQLEEIPAYIRIANDQDMLEMALVENIQREDLNAMEIALTYQRLKEECKLTDQGLSERVGKNRATITNYLRLVHLPPSIQEAIREKEISMGHARTLAGLKDIDKQLYWLKRIKEEKLSVRDIENLTSGNAGEQDQKKPSSSKKGGSPTLPDEYRRIQDSLSQHFGIKKLALRLKGKDQGQITIPFTSVDELNRILDIIEEKK